MNECLAAAGDLTELVVRLGRTLELLVRLSHVPEDDFGGQAGASFRAHASSSADDVADCASALALLAGGLARLGRELELALELRRASEQLPPQEAADVRRRADDHERRAQAEWRVAVSRYDQQTPHARPH